MWILSVSSLFAFLAVLSLAFSTCSGSSMVAAADSKEPVDDELSPHLNVYGRPLQTCSAQGMALTGYTRTGYCSSRQDDHGAHHICIDLNSITNNTSGGGGNFCQVTAQSDWCSSKDMPCHDDGTGTTANAQQESKCGIQHWCVCQWAFARYIERAGGCDQIQNIVCEAIHVQALFAYRQKKKYKQALECLVERCGISVDVPGSGSNSTTSSENNQ